MTIDEAIKSIEDDLEDNPLITGCRLERAKKLGIEALKKLKYDREPGNRPLYDKLPGETKD